ncbi:MAG: hypothetical protein AAF203_06245, partial [Pseudomonadota bacterium]
LQDVAFDFDINWGLTTRWCTGPRDYQDILKQEIFKVLRNEQALKEIIQEKLQAVMSQQVTQIVAEILQPHYMPVGSNGEIQFLPEQLLLSSENGNIMIKGEVVSLFGQSSEPGKNFQPFNINVPRLEKMRNSGLILSQAFLRQLLSQMNQQSIFDQQFRGQDIDGFRKLQKSRFQQFFVFPDLMNFSKKADFRFNMTLTRDPVINITEQRQGVLYFDTIAYGKALMMAPKNGTHVPYIHVNAEGSGQGWAQVQNQELHFGLYEPDLKLGYAWDPAYLKAYKPSKRMAKKTITKSLRKALEGYRDKTELPLFDFGEMGQLIPIRLNHSQRWIQLVYENPSSK